MPVPTKTAALAAVLLAATLAGCATGPAYVRPSVPVPPHYKEVSAATPPPGWTSAAPDDTLDRGEWWKVFHDTSLDQLESRVTVSNQTIKQAVANLQQAQALVGEARAAYMPTVSAGVAIDRSHTSKNLVHRALAGKTISNYSAGVDVLWEPDLFDRVGHEVDAANARAQASQADLASVTLSMHAQLAMDYIDLRELDIEASLLNRNVTIYAQARDIVKHRFDAGIAPASDVAEAESQLEATQAQLIDLGANRARYEDAIALLIGVPASRFSLPKRDDSIVLPSIPTGVPSDLLERRPDIAAAERRVAAANADVGEATSAFFPDLMLSASGGMESSTLGQWASLPSHFWSIGPALVGTLFDGGRRKEALKAAQAKQDAATAVYRQTVLSAFQEVEDNLASLHVLGNETLVQQRAVDASSDALRLAMNRYQAGAIDYLEVVSAQSTNLQQTEYLSQLSQRRLDSDILLIKALGGLWTPKA
jgi:NodT family efflux transporter outer membrane factor (OMF) lipoprotein